jgi:hypothetical protein
LATILLAVVNRVDPRRIGQRGTGLRLARTAPEYSAKS